MGRVTERKPLSRNGLRATKRVASKEGTRVAARVLELYNTLRRNDLRRPKWRRRDANGTFCRRCQPLGDFHYGSRSVTCHAIVKAPALPALPETLVTIRRFPICGATLYLALLAITLNKMADLTNRSGKLF